VSKETDRRWTFGETGPRITSRMELNRRRMVKHDEMIDHMFATHEKRVKKLWRALWFAIPVWLLVAASWVTHVVVTIKAANWIFLAIGGFIFPIGCIHGIGVWFGVW